MDKKKHIPTDKQNKKEVAINQKGIPSDGATINSQVQDKKEQHQPRDNA